MLDRVKELFFTIIDLSSIFLETTIVGFVLLAYITVLIVIAIVCLPFAVLGFIYNALFDEGENTYD